MEGQQEIGESETDEGGISDAVGHGLIGVAAGGVQLRSLEDFEADAIGIVECFEDVFVGEVGTLLDGGVQDLVRQVLGKEIGHGLPSLEMEI